MNSFETMTRITKEYSAGVIIFRKTSNEIEYLLLKSRRGLWGPPKGHLENNETDFEAALREVKEEAGLELDRDYKIISEDFKIQTFYPLKSSGKKRIIYWLGEINNNAVVKLSHEHKSYEWFTIDNSQEPINFDVLNGVMRAAHDYITKNYNKI